MTTDERKMICLDMLNGRPPRVKGKEADEYRVKFQKEMDEAEKKGHVIELPFEIEVAD